ncbi:MAG: glycosyltransferase family 2 protein [Acidimicrobiia bacterium]|nr:glycosyltransferase family 2 protein [Acidimicrobiia bacterium]
MSNPEPRASVVIPTHNRAQVVGRAVTSVLRQELADLEVIVVDDGSTDDTKRVLDEFADDRLQYLFTSHVGAAEARNIGARHAASRWLTFLDSDDTVTPDWLASLLAEAATPGTALVSCGYEERSEGSDIVLRRRLPHPASPSVGPIVELIETGGSYLVDRELFLELGGFDPEQRAAQHQELALRLGPVLVERGLLCGAVMRPLVERWVGRGDNIRADDDAVLAGTLRILDRHRARLELDRPLLANTAATAAYRAVRLGRFTEARRLARAAVRADPRNPRHWARLGALIAPRLAYRHAGRPGPDRTAPAS